jgi:hypothetical protein
MGILAVMNAGTAWAAPSRESEGADLSPQVALDWNLNAVNAVRAYRTMDGVAPGGSPRALYQPEGNLYMTYVQLAEYDAVMKITHRYVLYHHFSAGAGNASPAAATIAAAYNTLAFYLGDPNGALAAEYAASIARLPADRRTQRGIAVGQASAADIEELRAGDGRNAAISDTCPVATVPPTPGAFLCAPLPSGQSMVVPWLGQMRPFMLDSPSQFRAPAPPALDSAQYAADLNETRTFGASNSAVRTPAETATALFWFANVINQINQALRDFTTQHQMDLVDTVRVLTMGETVGTDASIGCFDSKYHYMSWRPITAIRADGVAADATWTPLAVTPNHPEYPSQHACEIAALGDVLANVLGTTNLNVTIPGFVSPTVTVFRTYATEQDLNTELANARVWIGYHFRTSTTAGHDLGDSVAAWTMQRFFRPRDDQSGDD